MAVGYWSSSTTAATDDYVAFADVPVPSGAAAGMLAVVGIVRWEAANPAITAPAGFTQITQVVNANEKLAIFWKRLTGADSGTYSFTWSGPQYTGGQCILVTGAVASGDPIGANFNGAVAATSAIATTSVSPAYAPGLLHFVSNESASTQTPPTSFTEVQDGSYLHCSYRIPGSAGTYSATGGVLSVANVHVAALVAVEPAAAGSSVTLDGAGQASNGATGTASTTRPVTANASASNGAGGSAAAARAITASAGAASGATGAVSVARGMAGSSPASSSLTGDVATVTQSSLAGIAAAAASLTGAITVARGLAASGDSASDGSALSSVARSIAGLAAAAAYAAGDLTLAALSWRLVMPTIRDRWTLRGSLSTSTYREVTVFGDEDGLFTTEQGTASPGTDEYGAIPFATKYIWYGGHVNTTDDPAVKDLWLDHGFEVESVQVS